MRAPTLEETYHPGAALELYAWPLPSPPTCTEPRYDAPPIPTQRSERYNKSIAERVTLPSTSPPAVRITLEERLQSSIRRVPHVWTASVSGTSSREAPETTTTATTTHAPYPPRLVAKIYDPVFFDDDETECDDPFYLRDLTLPCEVEAYQRLKPLQGKEVPRFYGYFVAALPAQHCRTIYIILLEEVPGTDLRVIVPPDATENICAKHKEAIVDAALRLYFDVMACGVWQLDMQSRNVILRPQKHASLSVSDMRFCDGKECMLAREVDCDDLHMVMVDFEMVDFEEPDTTLSDPAVQRTYIEAKRSMYLRRWLKNGL